MLNIFFFFLGILVKPDMLALALSFVIGYFYDGLKSIYLVSVVGGMLSSYTKPPKEHYLIYFAALFCVNLLSYVVLHRVFAAVIMGWIVFGLNKMGWVGQSQPK